MMITFVVTEFGLLPWDKATQEFVNGLTKGEPIVFEPWFDRDMHEHRKIFAQIAELAKAMGISAERLRGELLVETGNFHFLGEMFGKTVVAVSSMSRHSMRDHELLAFWEEAKEVILHKMLTRITDVTLRQQLAHSLSASSA